MNNTALQKSKRIIIPTVLSVCLAAFVEHAAALPGDLDLTFGGTGTVTAAIGSGDDTGNCMVIQNDGRIVVAGYSRNGSNEDFALVRYNADGTLDTGFNGNGKVITDFGGAYDYGYSVALQGDGKIVVAGWAWNPGTAQDVAVLRYNSNGTLDTTFNGTGEAITDFSSGDARENYGQSVAVLTGGKILVGGYAFDANANTDFALIRYNANGSLDTSFSGTGKVATDFGGYDNGAGMTVQKDGKILIAGATHSRQIDNIGRFALARYNPNGTLDSGFGSNGKVTTSFAGSIGDNAYVVAVQTDGNIVVAGASARAGNGAAAQADFALARYESYTDNDGDGVPDRNETGTGIYVSLEDTGTSPTNPDSDGDGLSDGQEVNTFHSNPNIADTDSDGFADGFEVSTGFNPTSNSSTPDAFSSVRTAIEYRFAAASGVSYRIEASDDLLNWSTIETNITGTGTAITRFYSTESQPKRYFRSRRN